MEKLNAKQRFPIFPESPKKIPCSKLRLISTGAVLKNLEKWKVNGYKTETVEKVESAGENVEKTVESVNTMSISPAFPHSGSGNSQKPCKYAPCFQLFIQHLLKTQKSEHTLSVIIL